MCESMCYLGIFLAYYLSLLWNILKQMICPNDKDNFIKIDVASPFNAEAVDFNMMGIDTWLWFLKV